jgi:hypothetical protein
MEKSAALPAGARSLVLVGFNIDRPLYFHRVFLTAALLLCPAAGFAVDRMPAWMTGEGGFGNSLDYSFHYAPGDSPGGGVSPSITDSRLRADCVLFQNDVNTWAVHSRLGYFDMSDSPVVSGTGLVVPKSLWSVEAGGTYGRKLPNGRQANIDVNVGSDSDVPFHSIHETAIRTTGRYRIQSGKNNAWLLLLSYSNNRAFANNIPLPGFAYLFRTSDRTIRAVVGFPFASVTYQPVERWSASASLFGPTVYNFETDFLIMGPVKLTAEFGRNQQMWLRANRDDNSNRLVFDEKKSSIGLRSPIARGLVLDVSGGREFNRRFYENHSATNGSVSEADIPSSWFFEARLNLHFSTGSRVP